MIFKSLNYNYQKLVTARRRPKSVLETS